MPKKLIFLLSGLYATPLAGAVLAQKVLQESYTELQRRRSPDGQARRTRAEYAYDRLVQKLGRPVQETITTTFSTSPSETQLEQELAMNEQKLSRELFTALVPLITSNNASRILGNDPQTKTFEEQEVIIKSITTFVDKLKQKIDGLPLNVRSLLGMPNFTAKQPWMQELITQLLILTLYCKDQITRYKAAEPPAPDIKKMAQKYTKLCKNLQQLDQEYLPYIPPQNKLR